LIDANRPYPEVLEEYTAGGIIKVSYVHGRDLISHQLSGERFFYHFDGVRSTGVLTMQAAWLPLATSTMRSARYSKTPAA